MPYSVYAILLKKEVTKSKRFMERNPQYIKGKPCFYVGYTSKSPDERSEQHRLKISKKNGKRNWSYWANKYHNGLSKRGEKYGKVKDLKEGMANELKLSQELRAEGCGVWTDAKEAGDMDWFAKAKLLGAQLDKIVSNKLSISSVIKTRFIEALNGDQQLLDRIRSDQGVLELYFYFKNVYSQGKGSTKKSRKTQETKRDGSKELKPKIIYTPVGGKVK